MLGTLEQEMVVGLEQAGHRGHELGARLLQRRAQGRHGRHVAAHQPAQRGRPQRLGLRADVRRADVHAQRRRGGGLAMKEAMEEGGAHGLDVGPCGLKHELIVKNCSFE